MNSEYFKYSHLPDNDDGVYTCIARKVDGIIKFIPAVYVQRYNVVQLILKEFVWNKKIKVIDYGCSEMNFLLYLKNLDIIETVLEIDKDKELLKRCKPVVVPMFYTPGEVLTRPMKIILLAGDITERDVRTLHTDAVICLEVIEYLEPDQLEALPSNIFGFIKPKLAIFTTLNAEFNQLFNVKRKFRVKSHKFEWTRDEFLNWATSVIRTYPTYDVKLYGIGPGPEGTDHLGCCTQMAIFTRIDDNDDVENHQQSSMVPYEEIGRHVPLWGDNNLTPTEQMNKDLLFRISDFEDYCRYNTGPKVKPLSDFLWTYCTYVSDVSERGLADVLMLTEYAKNVKRKTENGKPSYFVIF